MSKSSEEPLGDDMSPFEALQLPTVGLGGDMGAGVQPCGLERVLLVEEKGKWSKKELRELHRVKKPPKPKKRGRPKSKYWYRKMKEREANAKSYLERDRWIIMGFSNYERLKYNCSSKGWTLNLTKEELAEMVEGYEEMVELTYPRYDRKSKVIDRYSIDILSKGRVVWSGSEAKLRDGGYIL